MRATRRVQKLPKVARSPPALSVEENTADQKSGKHKEQINTGQQKN